MDWNASQQAARRLAQLQNEYGKTLSLNYSGETGLAKNDLGGYARMQNAKVEAQNLQNQLAGRNPLNVEYGGMSESEPIPYAPTFDPRSQRSAVATVADVVDKDGNFTGYDINRRPSVAPVGSVEGVRRATRRR